MRWWNCGRTTAPEAGTNPTANAHTRGSWTPRAGPELLALWDVRHVAAQWVGRDRRASDWHSPKSGSGGRGPERSHRWMAAWAAVVPRDLVRAIQQSQAAGAGQFHPTAGAVAGLLGEVCIARRAGSAHQRSHEGADRDLGPGGGGIRQSLVGRAEYGARIGAQRQRRRREPA